MSERYRKDTTNIDSSNDEFYFKSNIIDDHKNTSGSEDDTCVKINS